MKKLITTAFTLAAFTLLLFNTSCGNHTPKEPEKKTTEIKADTAHKDTLKSQAYVCPMGPQCGQGPSAGKCPSCGMEMKQNPDITK
jgi:hypothetical protein